MTYLRAFILCLVGITPLQVHAHSVLASSTPADGAVVAAPAALDLTFAKGIRLTALGIAGQSVALPDQSGFGTSFAIPLPALPPGTHTVEWRGLSADGHVMKGTLTFTVE